VLNTGIRPSSRNTLNEYCDSVKDERQRAGTVVQNVSLHMVSIVPKTKENISNKRETKDFS
jgi:hypothetical protein